MSAAREPTPLEKTIGWTFSDEKLLTEALTHSTYANERPGSGSSNERLEFLGDAVLGLLTARILYLRLAEEPEGELTRRRAQVVRGEALAELGRALKLAEYLRLGEGQRRAGVEASARILGGAYEALAGAVFLDGGYEAVERCFSPALLDAIERSRDQGDPKTQLQELCHRRGLPAPTYVVAAVSGPDHARRYSCEVRVGEEVLGSGEASSKKTAEQLCAEQALRRLEVS